MTSSLGSADIQAFQRAVAERLGLRFDDGRETFLAEVLERRAQARRLDPETYLSALRSEPQADDELNALARELTVGETYFFRHSDQFAALAEAALPELLARRATTRGLRLLSAGCASGEEAYSLAILLRERGLDAGDAIAIQGVDLNPTALEKAARALYTPWSLRETPEALRTRWFEREGRDYRLLSSVREAVRFARHNLVLDAPRLLPPRSFDVVFCRNVLMYLTPEHAAAVVERLTQALTPGGFLFLGHAETLRGLSHAFQLRHTHGAFYYQLKAGGAPAARGQDGEVRSVRAEPAPPKDSGWVGTWLDVVERSSARIERLCRREQEAAPAGPARQGFAEGDLSQPLELLRHERFAEALAALRPSPGGFEDPAALLLRAALLTHQGELSLAEQVCHHLLRLDDLNAGAHYLLALCLERRGQAEAAIEHDRTAIYLDAGFAMPHLHWGLMARRCGDASTARQELTQALRLLEREEASRLLLFGGGFGRAALATLCRAELSNLTGAT